MSQIHQLRPKPADSEKITINLGYVVGVAFELTADGGPNEIGPVRIETFLHHEVDLPEVMLRFFLEHQITITDEVIE